LTAFHALPLGTHTGSFNGKADVFSKSAFAHGKSWKLVAEELGGTDYISLNLYDLTDGPRLFPCEMSTEKVVTFVCGLTVGG
ncbi:MAG: hypothetical protein OTI35_09260, partial [Sulfitobacter sp.]|nr:hypothetical protein [Sulfitobacter sp.]